MAVQPQTPFKEYTANGTTTVFPLDFDCKDKDHLIVMIDDAETDNSTWSLINDQVTFNVAPAADKKITLQRNTPYRRDRNYQAYDNSFRPGPVNDDFDWIWWKLQELGVADWILGNRINALKNYVDRKDDELKAYLMEEIRKQGVALDQLDAYYNYLMERLAQIAVDKGWDASFVVDGDKNQHQINEDQKTQNNNFKSKLRNTPYDYGAKGGNNDDTLAVKACIESGYFLINDNHNVKPFVIEDKYIDGKFSKNGKLKITDASGVDSIEFLRCHGVINNISTDEVSSAGVYATLLMRECDNLVFKKPVTKDGKLLPVVILDSPNCYVIDGFGYSTTGSGQQGWWLAGSRNSQFINCVLNNYNGGGFYIVGSGYKSGTRLMTTLPTNETLNMKAVNCFAFNINSVCYDINGAVGAEFLDCLAHQRDTVATAAGFQIKQSTNIPEETAFLTNQNKATNCVAVNCARAFFSQRGENNIWTNITAINCRNDVFSTNATPRTILRGLNVFNFALKNTDQPSPTTTKSYVVSFANSSTGCSAKDIFLFQDTLPQDVDTTGVFNLASAECEIDGFKISRRGVAGQASIGTLLDVSSTDCTIGDGIRYASASIYKNGIIDDSTNSTKYPINIAKRVDLSQSTATINLDIAFDSEVTIGNVIMNVFSTTKNVVGAKFAAGDANSIARYVNLADVPNGRGSFKPAASSVTAREIPFAVRVETTGSNVGIATILMKGLAI